MFHSDVEYAPFSVCGQALFGVYKQKHKNVLMGPMNELADKRRKILASLITDKVTLADVARMFGKPDRQIKDMIAEPPRKHFGDKVARQIEEFAIEKCYTNIRPYFFDGIETAQGEFKSGFSVQQQQASYNVKLGTVVAGMKINSMEENLLNLYRKLSGSSQRALDLMANHLYTIEHPNDLVANPTNGKKKKEAAKQ